MSIGSLLFTVLILLILSQYPYYIRKYKPQKYVDIVYTFGEANKTPLRALIYPLVHLIVGLIYIFFIQ
jgi:hypothetical protein